MTPQQIAFLGSVVAFVAGFAAKQGWINDETYKWLISPDTVTTLSVVVGGGIALYGLIISRQHGLIKTTNSLASVDAVITKEKTAAEINTPGVVGSVEEAEKVVRTPRRKPHLEASQPPGGASL